MSKRSQTELAVLGVLSIEPMSGYAVRRTITDSMGLFWSESFGQIYPTLARLLEDGLVAPAAQGRTSGSSYALTDVGRRHLRRLLSLPVPSTPPRNGRLLRLFFGALVGAQACAEVVEQARTSAAGALARLAQERADLEKETDPGASYRRLVLSAGEHAARAQLAWAEESLVELSRLAEGEAAVGDGSGGVQLDREGSSVRRALGRSTGRGPGLRC